MTFPAFQKELRAEAESLCAKRLLARTHGEFMDANGNHLRTELGPDSRAVLLVNLRAGRNKWRRLRQVQHVKQKLEHAGIRVAIEEIGAGRDGSDLARQAVDQGVDLIIVCGGDGTINHVLRGIVPSHVPLAILPGGTANMLARELGIPLSIERAAGSILTSLPRRIALGSAGGWLFISVAGVGFDARVVRRLDERSKAAFGMGSYLLEGFRQLFFGPPNPLFTISAEGQRQRVGFACIARSRHYGPVKAIPEADLFSDQFYVYGFPSQSRWRYLRTAVAILAGRHSSIRELCRFSAQRVDCEPLGPQEEEVFVQVDGELAGRLPCRIEIVPDALTLLVPSASGVSHGLHVAGAARLVR